MNGINDLIGEVKGTEHPLNLSFLPLCENTACYLLRHSNELPSWKQKTHPSLDSAC